MQVTLPQEIIAAAQAAAATLHGQSQQFSVRLMTSADDAEAANQPVTPADSFTARGSGIAEQSTAAANVEPVATGEGTPEDGGVASEAVSTEQLVASLPDAPRSASRQSNTAGATPESQLAQDDAAQPLRAVQDQPDKSSHNDGQSALGRERQTMLASDEVDSDQHSKPSAYKHAEL